MPARFGPVIPTLRMFDETKAREFYVEFLGCEIEFEARFDPNAPLYMRIRRAGLILDLSEHHGDGSPGAHVMVETEGLDDLHAELTAKKYKYGRPGIEEPPWNARTVTVHDPFGNVITFSEPKSS